MNIMENMHLLSLRLRQIGNGQHVFKLDYPVRLFNVVQSHSLPQIAFFHLLMVTNSADICLPAYQRALNFSIA